MGHHRSSATRIDQPKSSMATVRMNYIRHRHMLHQFDLSGTGLNRHIGYEASVLHSKPSDNFGEVTITGLASVDQRSAISDPRSAIRD